MPKINMTCSPELEGKAGRSTLEEATKSAVEGAIEVPYAMRLDTDNPGRVVKVDI